MKLFNSKTKDKGLIAHLYAIEVDIRAIEKMLTKEQLTSQNIRSIATAYGIIFNLAERLNNGVCK